MADFQHVQSLQTVVNEYETSNKAMLQLKIAGAAEVSLLNLFSLLTVHRNKYISLLWGF